MRLIVVVLILTIFSFTYTQNCRANPDAIRGLEPAELWANFYQISCIPRCPTKEKQIRDSFLKPFASRNGYQYKEDAKGNVLITVPATPGKEGKPTIVLQTHLDMVCEKNRDSTHDFDKDPIQLVRSNDRLWIHANRTSLGSDDGIGVAQALFIVKDPKRVSGPIELLFTVEEEIGLRGAMALESGFLVGRTMINIDSDHEGVFTIGCAGGSNLKSTFKNSLFNSPTGDKKYLFKIRGLNGGHSGVDINKHRANAIKVLTRSLNHLVVSNIPFNIVKFDAGDATNAIPREASAFISFKPALRSQVETALNNIRNEIRAEFSVTDPNLGYDLTEQSEEPGLVFEPKRMLSILLAHPHGVMRMSPDIPDLVETSINLAVVKTEGGDATILCSIRSSVNSGMIEVQQRVQSLAFLAGGSVEISGQYPGWKPDINSKLLQSSKTVYKNLFGNDAKVEAIHAGLETGVIGAKYPGMDMISIGATTTGLHSINEKLLIASAPKNSLFVLKLLEELAK